MSRVDYLGRSGMYEQAFMHIIAMDYQNFPYVKEDFKRINETRKYDPEVGTTSPEWQKLCDDINKWLNEHYDMFEIDYTHFDDYGSRDECVLCYTKRTGAYEHPDFQYELPKLVCYR